MKNERSRKMLSKLPSLIKHQRRVAIVGLPNSGKTVLLTSLLIHLENRSSALTDGGKSKIKSFKPRHKTTFATKLQEFPYKIYRSYLQENCVFPTKTTSETVFSFDLEMSNGKQFQIQLLDVPGERFYDISMCGRSYGEWCDELEKSWHEEPHPEMQSYRKLFHSTEPFELPVVIAGYRKLLANLIADYRTLIAPSRFRVNSGGGSIRGRTADAILLSAVENPCGISLDRQFAPIFGTDRTRHEALVAVMSKNYNSYRDEAVMPLFRELKTCDKLVLLIDVPYLLAAGAGAVADQTHLIDQVLKALVPKQGKWRSLGRGLKDLAKNIASVVNVSLWPGRVKNVAFVATKADIVPISDVQDNRLSRLLSQVINPTCSYLEGIEPKEFVLSAVKSTSKSDQSDDEVMGHLSGRLQFDYSSNPPTRRKPTDAIVDYDVPRLPREWPHNLDGKYSYPPVFPDMPQFRMLSPKEENLKKLFDFIIE